MSVAAVTPPRNTLATVSLVLGVLTIIPGCLLSVFGSLIGLAAILTGVIALTQISKDPSSGKGLAIAGIIVGAIGAIVAPFGIIAVLMFLGPTIGNTFSTINSSLSGY